VVKTDSIEALVRLLDDPDIQIFGHVRNGLLAAGPDALPYLKNSLDLMEMEAEAIDRIELLIQELHFLSVKNELLTWSSKSEKDLLKGAFLIARYQFPELEFAQLEEQISTIEQTVWLELNGKQTSFEITKTLNNVFFELYGFQGADKSHFTPYHSFLNTVLEEREGTPLSISILYSIVAQRLGIPIYGVSFPNHFLVAYMDEFKLHRLLQSEGSGGVLFYIDPYSKGEFLSKGNLEDAIQRLSLSPKRNYFEPASHSEILARMLNNLIHTYTQLNRTDKVQDLQALRACLLVY
jgi:regulator of sirC expression with transglutaminase-like and TPR domain